MGQPSSYNSGYPPTSTPFTNTYPPNSSGMNQPQPNHYGQAPSAYPPAAYPPQANNPQPPCGYPPQGTFYFFAKWSAFLC